jgi:3'-phosphoadenosine 5'-phosphosulfate sulfotransferase (PAPS reductase)/FAD synthetase
MVSLTYEQKIKMTNIIIAKALKHGKPALLFSGGKDSAVLLDLVLKQAPRILVLHNDTTIGSPENLKFIRRYTRGLNYRETTADDPFAMWTRTGYYPILGKRTFTAYKRRHPELQASPVQCCYQLKEKYANRILKEEKIEILLWGNRATESDRRKLTYCDNGFIFKPKKYSWHQGYPLQVWTSEDIKKHITEKVKYYPIQKNYESGCLCCATDIKYYPNNLSRLFQNDRKLFDKAILAGFGRQILLLKGIPGTPEKNLKENPEVFLKV